MNDGFGPLELWDTIEGVSGMEARAREVLGIRRARKYFSDFVPFITRESDQLVLAKFHYLICEHLQGVADGTIKRLIINMPPRHGKPVSVGSYINEKTRGRIRLADIQVGDLVLTHRGRFRTVLEIHEQGTLPLLKITTYRGRIVRTAHDHPFLTPKGWIEAFLLGRGDVLFSVMPNEDPIPDPIISIEAGGDGECRCLTVEEDETFTANDIAVHNSTLATALFPAWLIGQHPKWQFLVASADMTLAQEFSKRVQSYVTCEDYSIIFPGVELSPDSTAAGKWMTNKGGIYRAFGTGSGSAGRGANLAIVDDPIGKREDAFSPTVRQKVWDWFGADIYSRLEPDAAVIMIHTRWHEDDPGGRLIQEMKKGREKWTVLSLPAICENEDSATEKYLGRKRGDALWPEKFNLEVLTRIRDESAMSSPDWSALYQQSPVPEGGSILLRKYWRMWKGDKREDGTWDYRAPGDFDRIILSIDTAFEEKEENDYSACTVWGVYRVKPSKAPSWKEIMGLIRKQTEARVPRPQIGFASVDQRDLDFMTEFRLDFITLKLIQEGVDVPMPGQDDPFDTSFSAPDRKAIWEKKHPYNAILLDAWHEKLPIYDLKRKLKATMDRWDPDDMLIEHTAAGIGILQELHRAGIKAHPINPQGKKTTRAHMVSGILEAGVVYGATGWKKGTDPRELVYLPQVDDVIEECSRFPGAVNDDFVDCVTQFLEFFRNMGAFSIPDDKGYGEDQYEPRQKRKVSPYA